MLLRRCLWMLIVSVVASACAWSQPPTSRQALLPPYEISGATQASSLGELMLTEDGLWAFVRSEDTTSFPTLKAGALVGFAPTDADRARPHLFAVVLERSWGLLLQRLDDAPLTNDRLAGDLVPLTAQEQAERWGLCFGQDSPTRDECVGESRARSWRIFAGVEDARIVTLAPDQSGLAAPARTVGMLHHGRATRWSAAPADRWVAVPARLPGPVVAHARVAIDPSCGNISLDGSLQRIEVVRADVPAFADAVGIEAAAARLGVDALLDCEAETSVLGIASLYRPLLEVGGSDVAGTAFGAMEPLRLDEASAQQHRALILMGAALATGETAVADYYLEQAVVAFEGDALASKLVVDFMQVPAAAGRPEVALYTGARGSAGAWHRDNTPGFLLGRTWVHAGLGQTRQRADAMSRLSSLAQQEEQQRLQHWLAWTQLRLGAETDGSRLVAAAMAHFDDKGLDDWHEAARILIDGPAGRETSADLAAALAAAKPANCATAEPCLLDVYGLNFATRVAELSASELYTQLSSTARAVVRPGFNLEALETIEADQTLRAALLGALLPLLSPEAQERGLARLFETTAHAMKTEGACLEIPRAARLSERLGRDRGRRESDEVLDAAHWLFADALPAACESPAAFARSLTRAFTDRPEVAAETAPLLEAMMSKATSNRKLDVLERFASFTAEHEKGAVCKRWNLALAASSARAGRLEAAERQLSRAINCVADDQAFAHTESLLIGYLQFERTRSMPADLPAESREMLAVALRRALAASEGECVGLAELDYRLLAALPAPIEALTVAIEARKNDADLQLQTASTSLSRARAAWMVGRRLLAEGRPLDAAEALLEARTSFARVDHRVGLARVRFLEEAIFDGELERWAQAQDAPPSTETVALQNLGQLTAAQWSKILRAGRAAEVLAAVDVGADEATPALLRATIAASMVVQPLEDTRDILGFISRAEPFDALCSAASRQ